MSQFDSHGGQFTFREGTHQRPEVVGLLDGPFADFHDVIEILRDLHQQLLPDNAFSSKQSVKWILVAAGGLGKHI
jgi:hypothetical protein